MMFAEKDGILNIFYVVLMSHYAINLGNLGQGC